MPTERRLTAAPPSLSVNGEGRGLGGWVRSALSRPQLTNTLWDRNPSQIGLPVPRAGGIMRT